MTPKRRRRYRGGCIPTVVDEKRQRGYAVDEKRQLTLHATHYLTRDPDDGILSRDQSFSNMAMFLVDYIR